MVQSLYSHARIQGSRAPLAPSTSTPTNDASEIVAAVAGDASGCQVAEALPIASCQCAHTDLATTIASTLFASGLEYAKLQQGAGYRYGHMDLAHLEVEHMSEEAN
jgi:hypothetical protein